MKLKECSQCGIECYLWKAKPQLCKNCAARKGTNVYNGIKSFVLERNKPLQGDKKRKPINKVSSKFKDRMRAYMQIRDKYLDEHTMCEAYLEGCGIRANQIHHGAGKTGDLLFNTQYFKAVCDSCHHWIEINPLEAKKLGLSFDRLDK